MSQQANTPPHTEPPATKRPTRPVPDVLLPDALYSWNDIENFVRVGRTTWLRRVKTKTAPQPLAIGTRCTRYLGREVLAWIAAPGTYRASDQ